MRRLTFAALVVMAVVVCSGCFRATTKITVRQDGSGVIDQDVGASAQALALLRNFGAGRGDTAQADVQMFGPEQAQAAAAAMGVRFVSGEPIKTPEMEGYRAHYAFDDITAIKFNMKQGTPSQPGTAASSGSEPPLAFGFTKGAASSTLTIRVPQQAREGGLLPQMPGGGSPEQSAQALSMIMPMLRGLYVDVTLAVDGRVIKSTAPDMHGADLTLVQFDFDKVAASEGGLQKLQQITDPKQLKGIPGLSVLTEPVVTIEFGR